MFSRVLFLTPPLPQRSWLLMPQSLTSSFFFACSAFIPLSLSPLHPSDLDYTFLQLPELNNALPHISMQPDQKTKIPLRPLLSRVRLSFSLDLPSGLSPPSSTPTSAFWSPYLLPSLYLQGLPSILSFLVIVPMLLHFSLFPPVTLFCFH